MAEAKTGAQANAEIQLAGVHNAEELFAEMALGAVALTGLNPIQMETIHATAIRLPPTGDAAMHAAIQLMVPATGMHSGQPTALTEQVQAANARQDTATVDALHK